MFKSIKFAASWYLFASPVRVLNWRFGYSFFTALKASSAIKSLFLAIKYAASNVVPEASFVITSTNKYDNVLIADATLAHAGEERSSITVGSKYLWIEEYWGT